MEDTAHRAIAIVGVGAILPDAPNAPAFWENLKRGRYSISEVTPDRWDPALYYDADPKAPDKSYSKIGGFVRALRLGPDAVEAARAPARRGGHGRDPEVGRRGHAGGLAELRLARPSAGPRAHGGDPRQRDGRGEALP